MFFDKNRSMGLAGAILSGSKSQFGPAEAEPEAPHTHELLTRDLIDAIHNRDWQGAYTAHQALWHHHAAQASQTEE